MFTPGILMLYSSTRSLRMLGKQPTFQACTSSSNIEPATSAPYKGVLNVMFFQYFLSSSVGLPLGGWYLEGMIIFMHLTNLTRIKIQWHLNCPTFLFCFYSNSRQLIMEKVWDTSDLNIILILVSRFTEIHQALHSGQIY